MNENPPTTPGPRDCRVFFGCASARLDASAGFPSLRVALPVLAGAESERLLADSAFSGLGGGWSVFRSGTWLAGLAVAAPEADLESAAGCLYRGLFEAAAGLHLYRVWTYVPQINALTGGMENYRLFCRMRSLAFEEKFGAAFQQVLPASSAVGSAAGPLAVGFLAGRAVPRHFENPRQVPAWKYPAQYGPRPPSFSRATAVETAGGRMIYVSGTAAIRGHDSLAAGLDGQLSCTLENLSLVGEAAGAGPDLGGSSGWRRSFKVYLRHPADLAAARSRLDGCLLRPEDTVSYLRAEICRADLLVEIEATLTLAS
jgi:enamine deaminase RidA (YjgF/YER057c/UK114 family)